MVNRILVILAHPTLQKSRINNELVRAIEGVEGITLNDLYESYPDFLINVQREQELLLDHDIIVLQHPLYWYSGPAILKEWEDLVLEYGFAYGHEGTLLQGKKLINAITIGGTEKSYQGGGYNKFKLRDFLRPYEQAANLCGMDFLPPFVVYGTHELTNPEEIAVYKGLYVKTLEFLRDNIIVISKIEEFDYIIDYFLDEYQSWSV